MGAVAVPLMFLLFKALSGAATLMDRSVAFHQIYDLFVPLLDIIRKEKNRMPIYNSTLEQVRLRHSEIKTRAVNSIPWLCPTIRMLHSNWFQYLDIQKYAAVGLVFC